MRLPSRSVFLCLLGLLIGLAGQRPAAQAQFAGCAIPAEAPLAARFVLPGVYDRRLEITVLGLKDFDPQLMIRTGEGQLLGCSNNSPGRAGAASNLPSAAVAANDKTAHLSIRFYADENPDAGPTDFELSITGADGQSGEFLLIVEGFDLVDGEDVDSLQIFSTPEQAAQNLPLVLYATNTDPVNYNLLPELRFAPNTPEQLICASAANSTQCGPNTLPLANFSLNPEAGLQYMFRDSDPMLNLTGRYRAGQTYTVEIAPQGRLSYGPYILAIHGGVGYPADFSGRG
jgi:hypothetical protein